MAGRIVHDRAGIAAVDLVAKETELYRLRRRLRPLGRILRQRRAVKRPGIEARRVGKLIRLGIPGGIENADDRKDVLGV